MSPGRYTCPSCLAPVIAKTGCMKVPHFAHAAAGCECPSAGESTSYVKSHAQIQPVTIGAKVRQPSKPTHLRLFGGFPANVGVQWHNLPNYYERWPT